MPREVTVYIELKFLVSDNEDSDTEIDSAEGKATIAKESCNESDKETIQKVKQKENSNIVNTINKLLQDSNTESKLLNQLKLHASRPVDLALPLTLKSSFSDGTTPPKADKEEFSVVEGFLGMEGFSEVNSQLQNDNQNDNENPKFSHSSVQVPFLPSIDIDLLNIATTSDSHSMIDEDMLTVAIDNQTVVDRDMLNIATTSDSRIICSIMNNQTEGTPICNQKKSRKNVRFECTECPAVFSQKGRLTYHMRKHSGEKPYVCSECSAAFSCPDSYRSHLRGHTGEKPYLCNQCGARFRERTSLSRHMLIHTGIKRYKCTVCGIAFARSYDLKGHTRVHTGEKPYVCDVCGRRFAYHCNFSAHKLMLHTDEKPFKCLKCGAAYKLSRALKKHMNTHLNEEMCENYDAEYSCDVELDPVTFTEEDEFHLPLLSS